VSLHQRTGGAEGEPDQQAEQGPGQTKLAHDRGGRRARIGRHDGLPDLCRAERLRADGEAENDGGTHRGQQRDEGEQAPPVGRAATPRHRLRVGKPIHGCQCVPFSRRLEIR
jgi:hypothetical protein